MIESHDQKKGTALSTMAAAFAWCLLGSTALLLLGQLIEFRPDRSILLPLNLIAAGVFFLVAK